MKILNLARNHAIIEPKIWIPSNRRDRGLSVSRLITIFHAIRRSIPRFNPCDHRPPFRSGFRDVRKWSKVAVIERERVEKTTIDKGSPLCPCCVRGPLLFLDPLERRVRERKRQERGEEDREPGGRVVHDQPLSARGSVFSVRLLLRERLGKWPSRNNFLWGFVATRGPWNFDPVKRFRDALRYRFLLSFHFLYFILLLSLFARPLRWCTRSPRNRCVRVRGCTRVFAIDYVGITCLKSGVKRFLPSEEEILISK